MNFRLVKPCPELEQAYIDYINDWENSGEKIVPFASRREGQSYSELLIRWKREASSEAYEKGLVPATLYFLIDERGKIYGSIHFRHELNDSLIKRGGHIGYGVRPSERKRGIATKMLSLALPIAKNLGINEVLVTCDKENRASAKTILKNNGILQNEIFEGNNTIQRYWVQL